MNRLFDIRFAVLAVAVLATGCAHNILEVPPPVGSNVSAYAWNPDSSAVNYSNAHSGVKVGITLKFNHNPLADGYDIVESVGSKPIDTLQLFNTADSVVVNGLTHESIIAIPQGYSMTNVKRDTSEFLPHIFKVFAYGQSDLVAADDSGRFLFSVNEGSSWLVGGGPHLASSERVTAFTYGNYGGHVVVGAGTSIGNFFYSSDNGKSWAEHSGPITSNNTSILAFCTQSNTIYALVNENQFGILKCESSNFYPFLAFPSEVTQATSFGIAGVNSVDTPAFVIGTATQGLYYRFGTEWIHARSANQPGATDNISFIVTGRDSVLVFGASGNATTGALWYYDGTNGFFKSMRDGNFVTGAYDAITNRFVLAMSDGSIFSESGDSGGYLSQLPSLSANTSYLTSLCVSGKSVIAATYDSGMLILPNNATAWANSSNGIPRTKVVRETLFPQNMRLLATTGNAFAVNTSWNAGSMQFGDSVTYTLNATVTDHFDRLQLTDSSLSYPDVFSVSYVLVGPDGLTRPTLPSWTVYFAKNQGPVLINQIENGVTISQTSRSK